MAVYFVSYDLQSPGQDYKALGDRLRTAGGERVLESVRVVRSLHSADDVLADFQRFIDVNDRLLVVRAEGAVWRNLAADPNTVKQPQS